MNNFFDELGKNALAILFLIVSLSVAFSVVVGVIVVVGLSSCN